MRLSNSLMRVEIIARSISSTASATSASTVRIPGRSMATNGAWLASTPKSPAAPGTSTCSTSPENSNFSGETRSKWKVAIIYLASASAGREAYTKPDDAADQSDDGDVLNLAAG